MPQKKNKCRRSLIFVFVSLGLWLLFFLLFLYILPDFPIYSGFRDDFLTSKNVQFMALIATLLGFTVVINYLINLIYKIEGVGRDQEEMNSRLKEVELKLELAKKLEKKEEEFFEAIMNKASKSDLDEKKENIVALREEIKNYK